MKVNDLDICECGDFRSQHAEGWRNCEICQDGDAMNGRECLMFRPHHTASVVYKAVRR